MTDECRACGSPVGSFAQGTVLEQVDVRYDRCPRCGMVQAADPTWLPEAYSDVIAKLDVGLLDRCIIHSSITAMVLRTERLRKGTFLDWAGGYGTLTRMMRDRGFDFVHTDPMAVNVFAQRHEIAETAGRTFDLITAFEVLEHLPDPVESLLPLASATRLLLVTTNVLPDPPPQPKDWWYYTPESGQHITFFTPRSLEVLASRLGFDGVVTSPFVHLFYRGSVSAVTRALVRRPSIAYGLGHLASLVDRRHSLLANDLEQARG